MISSIFRERFAPPTAGVLWAVLCLLWNLEIPNHVAKEILAAVLSAAAICAGFLTTSLPMLMTLGSTSIGRRLRRRKHLKTVFNYLKISIFSCLALCGVCIVGFFQVPEKGGMSFYFSSILVGFIVYSGSTFIRVVPILIKVFEQMSEPENKDG